MFITYVGFSRRILLCHYPRFQKPNLKLWKLYGNMLPSIQMKLQKTYSNYQLESKTIQTLIKRLVSKKLFPTKTKPGICLYSISPRRWIYTPGKQFFLKRYYNGNLSSMLASYLEDDKLSSTEIDNLRHLLSKHQK